MKSNKLYLIVITVIVSCLLSCEGSLDSRVFDRLSDSNFPKTAADAKAIVNGVYLEFRGSKATNPSVDAGYDRYSVGNESRFVQGLFCTDEFDCYWNYGQPFNFLWQPDGFPYTKMYESSQLAITKATSALAYLRCVEGVEEKLMRRYIAEVKACRAYFMYDLYNLYGPVPVLLSEDDALNIKGYKPGKRPSAEWMSSMIEKDLVEAEEDLPEKYSEGEFGRMTRGAAYMGLLKLYLHDKKWKEVIDMAEKINSLNVYELESNYESIWSIDNERNNEIIFAIPSSSTVEGVPNTFRPHVLPAGWLSPNNLPVVAWNGYRVPWAFYDTFDEDDLRRNTLHRYYKIKDGEGNVVVQDARITSPRGAIPLKYGEDPNGDGVNSGIDYIIYRYADVLLAWAEALNQVNGPNQQAIDLINQVRKRAFSPEKPVHLSDFSSKEDLNNYILQERGWELCFEGNRREDLIRHGKFVEFANDKIKSAGKNPNGNAKPYHVLYPIPSKAFNENPELGDNNQGY